MTDFQGRYDQKLRDYEANLKSVPSLTGVVPELSEKRLRLLFKRNSQLLGQIDKGKVRRPEHLAYGNSNVCEASIQNLDNIPPYAGDAHAFLQHVIGPQNDLQRKLEFAVGLNSYEYEAIRTEAAAELRAHVKDAQALLALVNGEHSQVARQLEKISEAANAVRTKSDEISLILSRAEKFRERLELLDGDARRADSLERLVRSVTKKVSDAEDTAAKIPELYRNSAETSSELESTLERAKTEEAEIARIRSNSEKILNLASQAGLASSYINERKSLSAKRIAYNGIFYVGVFILAGVAAKYVLPVIENFAVNNVEMTLGERALVLIIRSVVLAPIIWALVFTSARVKMIEALEIDYAEKAAASLAYHGYKSEMEGDASLLERLKSGLLVRFSEHPERLLRKTPPHTEVAAGKGGFRLRTVSTTSRSRTDDENNSTEPAPEGGA